ncbi:MAG: hypothetical protein KatS3mg023_3716 [Armatimonadota bacterium]|nr:MAG: hypothetical protein KatS3mg023_3716 [Armatimonadota bacterium]
MGRKHRNASDRDHSKLSLRGVKTRYNRMPDVALDTSGLAPWQHAVALAAAIRCRHRYSRSVAVSDDPYGVWQSCLFVVSVKNSPIKLDFSDGVVNRVLSGLREGAAMIGRERGLSDGMIRQMQLEINSVPYVLACYWRTVELIVGSASAILRDMVLYTGDARPTWLVPHKVMRSLRDGLPEEYVLVEQGIEQSLVDTIDLPVVRCSAGSPHQFVCMASARGCRAVVARSRDGLVLGWAANDRCFQVVYPGTAGMDILMHELLQVKIGTDGTLGLPPGWCNW